MVNLTLAIIEHVSVVDGEALGPVLPFALLILSMIYNQKLKANK